MCWERFGLFFEKLLSDALEQLLCNNCIETEKDILSDAAILQVCKILAKRRREEYHIIDTENK